MPLNGPECKDGDVIAEGASERYVEVCPNGIRINRPNHLEFAVSLGGRMVCRRSNWGRENDRRPGGDRKGGGISLGGRDQLTILVV
jgi:hypothetical protein